MAEQKISLMAPIVDQKDTDAYEVQTTDPS